MRRLRMADLASWRRGLLPFAEGGWLQLNAAGASPTSQEVHDATTRHLQLEHDVGGYEAEAQFRGGRDPRAAAAELLGCQAAEIAVTESAQSAWAKAFASIDVQRIFCWESEYAGNAVAFLQKERNEVNQVELNVLPMKSNGVVDLKALEDGLKSSSRSALIALTHVQTNSSIIQPAAAVGGLARKYNAIFLLDACQSIGQLPVDLSSIGCDFACATGRKWLRGPRGTGLLYARKAILDDHRIKEPVMIDHVSASWTASRSYELRSGARRFEMWEYSPALHAGLAAALDGCRNVGPEVIFERACRLADLLRERLRQIPGLRIADGSAEAPNRCAIVTFEAFALGVSAEFIKDRLTQRRITSSVAPASHTFNDKAWSGPPTLRLSPSYYNTEEEIEIAAQAVAEILKRT